MPARRWVGVGVVVSSFPPEVDPLLIVFLFNVTFLFALAASSGCAGGNQPRASVSRGQSATAVVALLSLVVLAACFVQESTGLLYALVIYAVLIVQFVLFRRRGMLELKELRP